VKFRARSVPTRPGHPILANYSIRRDIRRFDSSRYTAKRDSGVSEGESSPRYPRVLASSSRAIDRSRGRTTLDPRADSRQQLRRADSGVAAASGSLQPTNELDYRAAHTRDRARTSAHQTFVITCPPASSLRLSASRLRYSDACPLRILGIRRRITLAVGCEAAGSI